ncbi:[protein-PII] uridylyltransferase, partial [Nostoc sp. XA013]|nr:[protein-PII] uridylyltransferase [Nostoc sp. XA013]
MTSIKKSVPLIDGTVLRARLAELQPGKDLRPRIVAILKETLAAARAEAERQLMEDGRGTRCAMHLAQAQDEIIHALHDFAVRKLYRASTPSGAEKLAIVAVGGYGRGTLAPGSDIDLLFLLPYKQTGWSESVIEFILYALWDTRLKVGHATRSVDDCIRLAQSDSTILTSILEARYICGEESLFDTLNQRFRKEIAAKGAKAFVASKLTERDERHFKAGESRYLVEPDVKNGKGGLRDLHTLFWIAKFLSGANSTKELAEKGVFTREELALFEKSEDFLWAVRCHLHFVAKRAEDRLSFDRQPDLAERLGYKAHGGLKHVERFMKHYFLVAKDVGDLTRIFSASLEARQMKATPVFGRVLGRFSARRSGAIAGAPDFRIEANRLTVVDEEVLISAPVNMIRLFALAAEKDLEIHPDALKAVRRNLARINKEVCADAEANALFLKLLTESRDPETALRRMNEAGVLGRFIPEFGKIVAMMQFNMYHHYTVDEHLIRSIGVLAEIDAGVLESEHPLANGIMPTITNRRALYVALFLHDVAKGRIEDHSVAGARIARKLGPRLGLTEGQT